jgi:arylsulfatase A
MRYETITSLFFASLALIACNKNKAKSKPNVILIMADDMGYECLSCYGSLSYKTPVLDSLASHGMLFGQCHAQPLSTPSRVKLMTGLYNYRNYDYFDHLANDQYTFGSLMKEAGYSTCIAGKWQLNGISYKDIFPYWNDTTRAKKFGFDEYCLWQYTKERAEGERYSQPLIEQNGKILVTDENDYGPDIFSDYILKFIERTRTKPFFVYYPMVLVHDPFVPTPDSEEWTVKENRYKADTSNFRYMVEYTDKIIGKITSRLKELKLDKNTILIFIGDNGTNTSIYTRTSHGTIKGGKGNTTDAGTHVPMIVYWPDMIREGSEYNGLVDFSDFLPALADMTGQEVEYDGHSFYPLLTGSEYKPKEIMFMHYDPRWGANVNRFRNQFARTLHYKLYRDGRLFSLSEDTSEREPLQIENLSAEEKNILSALREELNKHPEMIKTE